MALSDWDLLAFDHDGVCNDGIFKHEQNKSSLEIYKNWIYVNDRKIWHRGASRFTEPVIASIRDGRMTIGDFSITAERGPQNSVLVVASYGWGKDQRFFAGIGCYAYYDHHEYLIWRDYRDDEIMLCGYNDIYLRDAGKIECDPEEYPCQHVGVLPWTLHCLFDLMESMCDRKYDEEMAAWIDRCRQAEPIRVNQGDMFFASQHEGLSDLSTKVGKAIGETRLNSLMRK